MTKVIIKRWDGGVAQSERPETTNEHADNNDTFPGSNGGFNVFADPFKLTKLTSPTVNETASGASVTSGECPITDAVKRGTDGKIIGVGATSASGSSLFRFYRKDSSITGTWQQCSDTTSSLGVTLATGSAHAVLYKSNFYGFASEIASSIARLYLYNSDSSHTLVGTISDFSLGNKTVKPVLHSQDKYLYMAAGKTIASLTGETSTTVWNGAAFTTPFEITSICEYGTYLAILMQSPEGGIIGLWDRSNSTLFSDTFKVDNGYAGIIENIDGYLTTVTQTPYDPNSTSIPVTYSYAGTINVRMYVGGTMKLIKRATLGNNEQNSAQSLLNRKMIRDGRLYFSTNSNFLWSFGINRDGSYILARDYQAVRTGRTLLAMHSFFSLGEYLFACQQTTTGSPSDGLLQRTDSAYGSDPSYFTTPVNSGMPLEHRPKLKKLTKVYIKVVSLTSSGNVTVKYGYDTNSTLTEIINESVTSTRPKFYEAAAENDGNQFTVSRDLFFQVSITGQIDVVELGYEYDIVETLSN